MIGLLHKAGGSSDLSAFTFAFHPLWRCVLFEQGRPNCFLKRFSGGAHQIARWVVRYRWKDGEYSKKPRIQRGFFVLARWEGVAPLAARPRRSKACSAGVRPRENVGLFIKFPSSIWKNMEIVVHDFEIYIRIFHIAMLRNKTKCYFRRGHFDIFKSNV